jgi:hypothetical protein
VSEFRNEFFIVSYNHHKYHEYSYNSFGDGFSYCQWQLLSASSAASATQYEYKCQSTVG